MDPLHHRVAQAAATDAYTELNRLVMSLNETDLNRPTRCAGWVVTDVIFHLLLDAQRALVAFSSQATGTPDQDHVSYWADHARTRTAEGAAAHARFVRIAASAYPSPAQLLYEWRQTSQAVLNVIPHAPGARVVVTQDQLMTITDLLSTLAVEAVVHHLDMLLELPGKPTPKPGPVKLAADVLDALLGGVQRPEWDDRTWILKGTGREKLLPSERELLGGAVDRFPLIG